MRESIETLTRRIEAQPHLDEQEKQDLLALIADIESEIDPDAELEGDAEHPVKAAVRLAAGSPDAEDEGEGESEGFEERLLKIEASYPKTAAALGRIGHVLARMGI
jgi:hypothetical protein